MIEQFHFLRPGWLLLLLPLIGLLWALQRRRFDSAGWRRVIDARLLPFLLGEAQQERRLWPHYLLAAVGLLGILALAGPTWEKLPRPLYQSQAGLVILLDLSRSMEVADTRPSRLVRARHKIADILQRRREGQTALVVYAADAFTVTPLTDDVATIQALLPSLEPNLMPSQGSRAARALQRGIELFNNGGVSQGDLLLISDGFDAAELQRIEDLLAAHPEHRLSVLAVGTPAGGPIPLRSGGFLQDRNGEIVIATLNEDALRRIARQGGGVYASISADDLDINALGYLLESRLDDRTAEVDNRSAEIWRELGPGLLLLALPLAALAFRRGLIYGLSLFLLILPPPADALEWNDLWWNSNQQALELLQSDQPGAASERFRRPDWRGVAEYRAGDYAAALESWEGLDGETAQYNRATALAQLQRYPDALDAYDELLKTNPQHADARFNRDRIAEWLQQQQEQQQEQAQQQQQQQAQQNREQSRDGAGDSSQSADAQQQPEPEEAAGAGERRSELDDPQTGSAEAEQLPRPDDDAAGQPGDTIANLDQQMSEQASEQWLRKIPDDPGGLLRRKFLYQYRQRGEHDAEAQPW